MLLIVALQSYLIQGQDEIFEMGFEDEITLECPPQCIIFGMIIDVDQPIVGIEVFTQPSIGATVMNYGDSLFEVCFETGGFFEVIAHGYTSNATQGVDTLIDINFIYLESSQNFPNILGPTCGEPIRDSLLDATCLEACALSTNTYYIDNFMEGEWSVEGAESIAFDPLRPWEITVTWGSAGQGILHFISDEFCQASVQRCINIIESANPSFETLPEENNGTLQVCQGEIVYFTNNSENATQYLWNFGDGNSSNLFEPQHSYSSPGNYTISLQAFNHCPDCEGLTTIEIEVLPSAAPELSCLSTVCPGERVRYDVVSDNCQTFHWSISNNGTILSGGDISDDFIEIEWTDGPDGFIELLVENCNSPYCNRPTIFRVPIISPDGPIEGDAQVCSGEISTYMIPNFPGVEYNWSVSHLGTILAGQNTNAVSIQWNEVSSIQNDQIVSVTYGHCYLDCQGSDNFNVSIVPHMAITSAPVFCENSTAIFHATAGFSSQTDVVSSWSLFDKIGNEIWSSSTDIALLNLPLNYSPGKYIIRATPSNTASVCEDFIEKEFLIEEKPDAPLQIFGDSFICSGTTYGFQIDQAGSYETEWEVYDGSNQISYSGSIISHTFTSNGPYRIEARHIDLIYGCESDIISKIMQPTNTVTIYGPDENCLNTISSYYSYNLNATSVEWRVSPVEMADIKNKNSTEAEFFWNNSGTAQIILSVCGMDIIKNVIIHAPENLIIHNPSALCDNETAKIFTEGAYTQYSWRDEDGNELSNQDTVILGPGFYSLEVIDINGCFSEEIFNIGLYPTPLARASTSFNTGHCNVVSPTLLTANMDIGYSHQWYHNGVPVGTNSPHYTATDFGNYWVEITNNFGCSEISNTITIFEFCGSNCGVCNGQTCGIPCQYYGDIDINAIDHNCSQKEYHSIATGALPIVSGSEKWYIENADGSYTEYNSSSAIHQFTAPGYYTVILHVRLDGFLYPDPSCGHLFAIKDTVESVADFRYLENCVGSEISFFDISTYLPDHTITSWSWSFGDGNSSTNKNPQHTYTVAGTYTVTLSITTDLGCTSTSIQEITIHDVPQFTIDALAEACEDNPVEFEVNSIELIFNPQWTFDDPNSSLPTSDGKIAWHTFTDPGNYNNEAVAHNIYGCTNSESIFVDIVQNNLAGHISSSNGTILCEGDSTELSAPPGGIKWQWNTNEITDNIIIDATGSYEVIIEDQYTCQYKPDPIFIEVNPLPVVFVNGREIMDDVIGYWQDTIEACEGLDIQLQAFTNSNVTYIWSTSETTELIQFTAKEGDQLTSGIHHISVTVMDIITNCESEPFNFVIIIHENPADFSIALNTGTGCSSTPNILEIVNPDPSLTYYWSNGQTGTQIQVEESGIYTAYAVNTQGCETTSTNEIEITSSPRIDLFPTGCFVRCNPDTVCIPDIPDISYFEIFHDGTSLLSGNNPPNEIIVTQSGTYTIYLEHINGCMVTSDDLSLELYPGYGDVEITVFVDVNNNGIIDTGDTTIRDINVDLLLGNLIPYTMPTNANGSSYFLNVTEGTYRVSINTSNIPENLIPIIDSLEISIVGCDIFISDSLLLVEKCTVTKNMDTLLCVGDSILIDGNYYHEEQTVTITAPSVDCDTIINFHIILKSSLQATEAYTEACKGIDDGTIEIDASSTHGTISILWSHTSTQDFALTDLPSGEYDYQLNDGLCQINGSIDIDEYIFPEYEVEIINPLCPGTNNGQINILNATPELSWSLDSLDFTSTTFSDIPHGTYTIYFTNGKCTASEIVIIDSVEVDVFELPAIIDVPANMPIQIPHNYLDSIQHLFDWSPSSYLSCTNCPDPIFNGALDLVEINVLVTSPNGCIQEETLLMQVDLTPHIYIPNAFSPDANGVNDLFRPYVRQGIVRIEKLQIFNRWGDKLYEEIFDPIMGEIKGWNGSANGKYLNPELYLYKAYFSYTNGEEIMRSGEVHLVR